MKEVIIILNSSKNTKINTNDFIIELDKFVRNNKKEEILLSLYTFNSNVQSHIDHAPIHKVRSPKEINSLGECDFYNSLGIVLERVSDRINRLKGALSPEKVIVCIVSENYPDFYTDYSKDEIKTFITYQREDYFWDFTFFGIGLKQDVRELGILEDEIIKIDCTIEGMSKIFSSINFRL